MTLAELLGAGGGSAEPWTASLVVTQGRLVQSPLDWEVYRRIAATGSSATDPANDTTNYVAASYERCGAMTNMASSIRTNGSSAAATNYANGVTRTTPGAIATGARTLVLSLTGRGALTFLGHFAAVARTTRFEVLVDGRTVLDANLVSSAQYMSCSLLGSTSSNGTFPDYYAQTDSAGVQFRRTLQVYVTPSGSAWTVSDALAHAFRSIA